MEYMAGVGHNFLLTLITARGCSRSHRSLCWPKLSLTGDAEAAGDNDTTSDVGMGGNGKGIPRLVS